MLPKVKESEVAQLCPTPWTHYSLPGSSVHGIFQARILEWVAISFSRRSSWPRDFTQVSCVVGRCFTVWVTREVSHNDYNTTMGCRASSYIFLPIIYGTFFYPYPVAIVTAPVCWWRNGDTKQFGRTCGVLREPKKKIPFSWLSLESIKKQKK